MLRTLLIALSALAVPQAPVRTFDADAPGQPPAGFALATGRSATPGRWAVQRDGANQVVAHAAEPGDAGGFAVAVYEAGRFDSVEVSVRLSRHRRLARAAGPRAVGSGST